MENEFIMDSVTTVATGAASIEHWAVVVVLGPAPCSGHFYSLNFTRNPAQRLLMPIHFLNSLPQLSDGGYGGEDDHYR